MTAAVRFTSPISRLCAPTVYGYSCTRYLRTRINQVNHSCGRNSCATTLPGASQPVVAPYRTRIDVVRRSSHIVAVHTGGVNKGVNTRDTIMDPSRLRLRYHQWYALQTTQDAASQQTKARVTGPGTHTKRAYVYGVVVYIHRSRHLSVST